MSTTDVLHRGPPRPGRPTTAGRLARVVVVDDHPFFRDGLSRGLRQSGYLEVVGEAGTGREALELIRSERPDVAVLDYQMPDLDGSGRGARRGPGRADDPHPGAVGPRPTARWSSAPCRRAPTATCPRTPGASEIIDGRDRGGPGRHRRPGRSSRPVSPSRSGSAAPARRPVLSPRELEVLQGFARGLSIPALAAELYLGPSTVKTHTQRLYEKLGVSDRAAAVAEAMRRGLLE